MKEHPRTRAENQFWLTRGQLAALGVASASLSALAFFIGLRLGRTQAPAPPEPDQVVSVVSTIVKEDALVDLLARVEKAAGEQAISKEAELKFPQELVKNDLLPEIPDAAADPEAASVVVQADVGSPPEPPELDEDPPEEGWAVQLYSFTDADEAISKVEQLKEQGFTAYRVAGLVAGQTWHRVRVGPYPSRDAAADMLAELSGATGVDQPLVIAAR